MTISQGKHASVLVSFYPVGVSYDCYLSTYTICLNVKEKVLKKEAYFGLSGAGGESFIVQWSPLAAIDLPGS